MTATLIAHLSDLHFGRHDEGAADALLHRLAELQPHLVVITGDFTQRARTAQFVAARAFMDRLAARRVPLLAVPGNHDVPLYNLLRRLVRPHGRYLRHLADASAQSYADANIALVGVNTAHGWTVKGGRLGGADAARLRHAFAPAPLRGLVLHHPLQVGPALAAADVRLLFSGHEHRAGVAISGGVLGIAAGTAISVRRRGEDNSFNVVRIGPDRSVAVSVQTRAGPTFAPGPHQVFACDGAGWRPL